MRLIDADKLIDHLEKVKNESASLVDMAHIIGFQSVIDAQPTAYDVDAVVKQLEKRRMDALRRLNENKGTAFGCASEWVYNAWNDAIEIVKDGGIDGN